MALGFGILGPLEGLEESGRAVRLGPPKQRALLALLLLHPNTTVQVDSLVEQLWPERKPGRPRTAIQGYVSALRRSLGADCLETTENGYLLRVDPGQIDVRRFEELLALGKELLGQKQAKAALQKIDEALGLWRGPVLVDFAYDDWAQEEIARLGELRAVAREARIEARLALGEHADAVAEIEALLHEYPDRERLSRHLMLALYQSGRQVEALEWYQRTRLRLVEELGVEPGRELQQLHRAILNQEERLSAAAQPTPALALKPLGDRPTNLPRPPNPLIGRGHELGELEALLARDDVRLVTLTGPGGIGKTRLALQLAAEAVECFADGVWFVNLAPLSDPDLVPSAIAQTLAVKEQPGEEISQTLAEYLRERAMLLVLDNFEQVLDAAPRISALLRQTDELKLVVTSRSRLHLAGEREYPVPPLAEREAAALFADRAQAARPAFALNGNRTTVAEICRRLDQLPLAIELAASRIKLMPEHVLLERLSDRLKLLKEGPRDSDERQRTLRAAIDWSYDLLEADERTLFRRLAAFAGGARLEAIEAICNASGDLDVLEAVASLIDHSLLRRGDTVRSESRFLMLETIHEYAREKLEESGEVEQLRESHARYFASSLGVLGRKLWEPEASDLMRQIESDEENLRLALAYFVERGDVEAAADLIGGLRPGGIWLFWMMRGRIEEGGRWVSYVVHNGAAIPTSRGAEIMAILGEFLRFQGAFDDAIAMKRAALAIFRRSDAQNLVASTLSDLGDIYLQQRDVDAARHSHEEALALRREQGQQIGIAHALWGLGDLALFDGDLNRARTIFNEILATGRQSGEQLFAAGGLIALSHVSRRAGNLVGALELAREGLELVSESGTIFQLPQALDALAAVASVDGRIGSAARLFGAADRIRAETGLVDFIQPEVEGQRRQVRSRLEGAGESTFDEGYGMTVEEAVAHALHFAAGPGSAR